jgi:hypothetical protein
MIKRVGFKLMGHSPEQSPTQLAKLDKVLAKAKKPLSLFGVYEGSSPTVQNLLGLSGLLAPSDEVTVSVVGLSQAGSVRPFYPEHQGSFSYFRQVDGETICRLGNTFQRRVGHTIVANEVVRIDGNAKRAFEAKSNLPSLGFLFEVNPVEFDAQALHAMAEPYLQSDNPDRATAARVLVSSVINGQEELFSARARVESWYQENVAS